MFTQDFALCLCFFLSQTGVSVPPPLHCYRSTSNKYDHFSKNAPSYMLGNMTYTRKVGFFQSVNGRKDENPTRKTCSEYFKALRVAKMKNLDERLCMKISVRFLFCFTRSIEIDY